MRANGWTLSVDGMQTLSLLAAVLVLAPGMAKALSIQSYDLTYWQYTGPVAPKGFDTGIRAGNILIVFDETLPVATVENGGIRDVYFTFDGSRMIVHDSIRTPGWDSAYMSVSANFTDLGRIGYYGPDWTLSFTGTGSLGPDIWEGFKRDTPTSLERALGYYKVTRVYVPEGGQTGSMLAGGLALIGLAARYLRRVG